MSRWGQIKPSQQTDRFGPGGATSNRHPGAKSDCQGHRVIHGATKAEPDLSGGQLVSDGPRVG